MLRKDEKSKNTEKVSKKLKNLEKSKNNEIKYYDVEKVKRPKN